MHVFTIGVRGAIGGLVSEWLRARGDQVSGLVRSRQQVGLRRFVLVPAFPQHGGSAR